MLYNVLSFLKPIHYSVRNGTFIYILLSQCNVNKSSLKIPFFLVCWPHTGTLTNTWRRGREKDRYINIGNMIASIIQRGVSRGFVNGERRCSMLKYRSFSSHGDPFVSCFHFFLSCWAISVLPYFLCFACH